MNYGQDIFVEQMIKRRLDSKDVLLFFGIGILGALVVLAGVFGFLATGIISIAFFALVGAIAGMYFLLTRRNLEFEYAVTNGDVTVDKIINRRSRKRLTSFDCKDIEELENYTPEKAQALRSRSFDKTIMASEFSDGRNAKYVIVKSKKTGMTLVVFSPDDRTFEAMIPYLPRQMRVEYMREMERK